MDADYWLKYGYKEDGTMTCVRVLSESRPDKDFFYTEQGACKQVRNPQVLRISRKILEQIGSAQPNTE